MRYQIPGEEPRNRFANLAVRASAPYWGAFVMGSLPALVWSVANGFFLGCRDARRQAILALFLYAGLCAIGGARFWLYRSGAFDAWLGDDGPLADAIMNSLHFLLALGSLRFLVVRQLEVAEYRRSLNRKLPWGLMAIAALGLFNWFVVPVIYRVMPDIYWIWGPILL
jgi:hypothetical protein